MIERRAFCEVRAQARRLEGLAARFGVEARIADFTEVIAPGAFASEMNREARDHADAVASRIPAGRVGTTEDMAGAAIYLASRAGDYVVGSTLIVDGGATYARG